MKSNARARWARLFVQSDIPRATKALAAEFARQCGKEVTDDLIRAASDFDGASADAVDDDDTDVDEEDENFFNVEYGHDELEEVLLSTGSWNELSRIDRSEA
jgi:hypothetical protein